MSRLEKRVAKDPKSSLVDDDVIATSVVSCLNAPRGDSCKWLLSLD